MRFLEKDLEEIIFTSERWLLKEKGLYVSGKMYRQLRIGSYGVADLVTVDRVNFEGNYSNIRDIFDITVYELKKENIGISAFLQAIQYVKGIDRYLSKREFSHQIRFRIVLIGESLSSSSSFIYMADYLDGDVFGLIKLSNYTYSINIDGIEFKEHFGYKLTDEGF